MEIKRTTEILVETKRHFVIHQPETSAERILCPECHAPMLAAEQIAVLYGVSRRRIYRLAESRAAHFFETADGCLFVCPDSLTENLTAQEKRDEIG